MLLDTAYVRIHLPSGLRSNTSRGGDAEQSRPVDTTAIGTATPLSWPISSPRSEYQSTSPGRSIVAMKAWLGSGTGCAPDSVSLASGATTAAGVPEVGSSLAADAVAPAAVPAVARTNVASAQIAD
jgi:hypothetical protein